MSTLFRKFPRARPHPTAKIGKKPKVLRIFVKIRYYKCNKFEIFVKIVQNRIDNPLKMEYSIKNTF